MTGVTRSRSILLFSLLAAAPFAGGCGDVPVDPFTRTDDGGGSGGVGAGGAGGTGGVDGGGGTGGVNGCPRDPVGYFTVARPAAIGGGSVAPVTVTTLGDLVTNAARTDAAVIVVQGMIAVPAASQPFQVAVESRKTIVGADAASGLTGGGFLIDHKDNVLLQNLRITFPLNVDGVGIQTSTHVWIDHCELAADTDPGHATSLYPWLINIKHASDDVTISWTYFHDQFNTVQIGNSDNATDDPGHLTVTLHDNLFARTNSGTPRVRFGRVHVFNNQFQTIGDYAVASQMGAQLRVENNVFDAVAVPLTNTHESSPPGAVGDILNDYSADSGPNVLAPPPPAFTLTTLPYPFTPDSTGSIPALVEACAGTGKI
jgi:pectate lyase